MTAPSDEYCPLGDDRRQPQLWLLSQDLFLHFALTGFLVRYGHQQSTATANAGTCTTSEKISAY